MKIANSVVSDAYNVSKNLIMIILLAFIVLKLSELYYIN